MEKSRSFPEYSRGGDFGEFEFEDQRATSYNFNGPAAKSTDPEIKRKKRVASYNVFTMEGKLKSSVRNSFKWIKTKLTDIRDGL